ncbi:MAG: hypothetical protein MHMPM18_002496 [Marteilia pararefringens]
MRFRIIDLRKFLFASQNYVAATSLLDGLRNCLNNSRRRNKISRLCNKYLPHGIIFAVGIEYGIYLANEKKVTSLKHFLVMQVSDQENQLLVKKFVDLLSNFRSSQGK